MNIAEFSGLVAELAEIGHVEVRVTFNNVKLVQQIIDVVAKDECRIDVNETGFHKALMAMDTFGVYIESYELVVHLAAYPCSKIDKDDSEKAKKVLNDIVRAILDNKEPFTVHVNIASDVGVIDARVRFTWMDNVLVYEANTHLGLAIGRTLTETE